MNEATLTSACMAPSEKQYFPNVKQEHERRKRVWLECKFQLRSERVRNEFGKYQGTNGVALISGFAYGTIFNGFLEINQKYDITDHATSGDGYFKSVIRLSECSCLFLTNKLLGKGSNKIVCEGVLVELDDQKQLSSIRASSVALWIIENDNQGSIKAALAEDAMADRFQSKYIIKKSIYTCPYDSFHLFVLNKFSFTFEDVIKQHCFPPLEFMLTALADISQGLAEMHAKKYLHRDVKPANMAIKQNGRGLLPDLGFCVDADNLDFTQLSPFFAAPELAKLCFFFTSEDPSYYYKNAATYATDLWAFGISMYEIFSPRHEPPTFLSDVDQKGLSVALIKMSRSKKHPQPLFDKWKAENRVIEKIQNIICKLLSPIPEMRGSAEKLSIQLRNLANMTHPIDYAKYTNMQGVAGAPSSPQKMWKRKVRAYSI